MDDKTKQLFSEFQSAIKELSDAFTELADSLYEEVKEQVAQLSKKEEDQK